MGTRIARAFLSPAIDAMQIRHSSSESGKRGLVLGAFNDDDGNYRLTKHGDKFNAHVNGKLAELLIGSRIKLGKCQVFNHMDDFFGVAVAGLGKEGVEIDENENLNLCKEHIRIAAATGAKALQKQSVENIMVEEFGNAEASAEGAILGLWSFQEFVNEEDRDVQPKVILYNQNEADKDLWMKGVIKAQAQNIARRLIDLPANHLTPKALALAAMDYLCPCGVTVVVRDRHWIRKQRMFAYLNIAQGSCEPPYFVELAYCGGSPDDKPVVLAGKGTTFDSGGICLKECEGMAEFRGNCAGAATIIGVMKAIAQYKLPINVIGLLPLMENMPGGLAVKPGDILLAKNEKTIRVENPDNEGRLALADALVYAEQFKPCMVVTLANLTLGIRKAVGSACSGTYTPSDFVWGEIKKAGTDTGDRVWRMPLWQHYNYRNTLYPGVDIHNVGYHGHSRGGDSCLGAAFLYAFAPESADFLHLDITGTALITSGFTSPYYKRGFMTGRPTRTVIQFLKQMALPEQGQSKCVQ